MTPDVQTRAPDIKLPLTRVGVSNVRKMIRIPQGRKTIVLLVNLSCFVDLPSSQKGTHMSRDLEAINEIVEEVVKEPVYEIEGLCESAAQRIIKKHEYATKCEVAMESKLMLPRKTPSGEVQDFVKLIARAEAYRDKRALKEIGVEVTGMILPPSLKSGIGSSAQKAVATLVIEVPEGRFIKIKDMASVLESSMSAKTLGYVTDADEQRVTCEAYGKQKYVDAVVKEVLKKAVRTLMLPDSVRVTAKCTVEDPLSPHSLYVKMSARAGEIKSS